MKKWLAGLFGLAFVGGAIAVELEQFQPGPRLIDGSQLNKMVDKLNSVTNYDYQLLVAGEVFYAYTFDNRGTGIVLFDIASGPISDERVTAPANPYDGQIVRVASRVTITAFQFIANTGQTLAATTPTVLTASTTTGSQGYAWIYRLADKKWYRIQ